jgi:SAM-dependent methyltransferase
MDIPAEVTQHYAIEGLEGVILDAAQRAGLDLDALRPDDLAAVDEFHIGGRAATEDLAARMGLRPGLRLLDVGSGIGGPARYFAHHHGCHVTGVDLTEDYVRMATSLSKRVGLEEAVAFQQADAAALPFAADSFDGVYMLHVGMNVPDKAAVFGEVGRVLKPGAPFAIYDVVRTGSAEIGFPVPWAADARTSFVADVAAYRDLLESAGFDVTHERNRRVFAIDFFTKLIAASAGGPPSLGLHLVMGADFPKKVANLLDALERDLLAPTELIGRKRLRSA